MSEDQEVRTTLVDGVRVVSAGGEFDLDTIDALAQTLTHVPEDSAGTVLDLADVAFADSAFLHLLLRAGHHHRTVGTPLVLARPSTAVARLLDVTDTARAFTLAPSVPAATAEIRAAETGGTAFR
ncbi:STAS domain-containing protein [Streptomyces ziwulingensis]